MRKTAYAEKISAKPVPREGPELHFEAMDGRPTPTRSAAALTIHAAPCVLAAVAVAAALAGLVSRHAATGDWDPQPAVALLLASLVATAVFASTYAGGVGRAARSLTGERGPRAGSRGVGPALARLMIAELIVAVGAAAVATGAAAEAVGDAAGIPRDAVAAWDVAKWPVLLALAFVAFTAVQRSAVSDPHLLAASPIAAGQALALLVWLAAATGFALYLASFGTLEDTYGAAGSGVVVLVWLMLFGMLHYVLPIRGPGIGSLGAGALLAAVAWLAVCAAAALYLPYVESLDTTYAAVAAGIACVVSLWVTNLAVLWGARVNVRGLVHYLEPVPAEATANGSRAGGTRELVQIVGQALENDVAHAGLLRPLLAGGQAARLTDFELDLGDWGFTYGIAWAAARAQDPDEPDHSVAARALVAAEEVFQMYCAGGELPAGVARSNGHLNGGAHSQGAAANGNGHSPPRVLD